MTVIRANPLRKWNFPWANLWIYKISIVSRLSSFFNDSDSHLFRFCSVSQSLLKMHFTLFSALVAGSITSVLGDASISSFPNSLTLSSSFDPIKAAYWTGLPHHRRTPFSVSPDGKSAYLAYLVSSPKAGMFPLLDCFIN